MNGYTTNQNALAAMRNLVAAQAAGGALSESARINRFLNDRIDHYVSRGLSRSEAVRLASEDKAAQLD